jgi:hypothetical protein
MIVPPRMTPRRPIIAPLSPNGQSGARRLRIAVSDWLAPSRGGRVVPLLAITTKRAIPTTSLAHDDWAPVAERRYRAPAFRRRSTKWSPRHTRRTVCSVRGHIRIQDVEGVRETACECYETLRSLSHRLLGPAASYALAEICLDVGNPTWSEQFDSWRWPKEPENRHRTGTLH